MQMMEKRRRIKSDEILPNDMHNYSEAIFKSNY